MKDLLFLDTPCFIYLVENHPQYALPLRSLFSDLGKGKTKAVTSIVTVSEVLVKPLELKRNDLIEMYHDLFTHVESLQIISPSYNTAHSAASIRASYHFTLTDCFQLAIAKEFNCTEFLTNDAGLKKYKEVSVKLLSETE